MTGVNVGSVFVLGTSNTLGRSSEATVTILDPLASREHACLEPDMRGNMVLTDLSSSNGTFVGNKRVTRRPLRSGERFRIGSTEFLYGEVAEDVTDEEGLKKAIELISVDALRAVTVTRQQLTTLRMRLVSGEDDDAPEPEAQPPEKPAPGEEGPAPGKEGCGDPLHELARWRGWPRCPACGDPIKA